MTGYNAVISVTDAGDCPIALASRSGSVGSVARTSVPDRTPIEEFAVADDGEHDDTAASSEASLEWDELAADPEPIGATDRETIYRFERDFEEACVCEVIERTGVPVTSIRSEEGELILTVRIRSLESIHGIVADLRERFGGVRVRELLEVGEGRRSDPVLVDRDRLTERQRTVLETAYERGYFEYPRETNATELAEELDISRSTVTRHLTVAQSKLLEGTLDRRGDDE